MNETKTIKLKKFLIVIAALLIGFLMPYLSRVPLAFKYGAAWIWSYMPDENAFMWWNYLHVFSLAPIFIFGMIYVFGNVRWGFYAAVFAHFAVTFFCYFDFEEHPQRDDFLGFIIFPYFIGFVSIASALIALFAELFYNRRKMKIQIEQENKNAFA